MISNDYTPMPSLIQMMVAFFGAGAPVVGQRRFAAMVQIYI
tara:strand:+ start:420 stop:542 length:123 start_codon:yes stop_codon:yes gene_type:complete